MNERNGDQPAALHEQVMNSAKSSHEVTNCVPLATVMQRKDNVMHQAAL